jgi:hypothetical protein
MVKGGESLAWQDLLHNLVTYVAKRMTAKRTHTFPGANCSGLTFFFFRIEKASYLY